MLWVWSALVWSVVGVVGVGYRVSSLYVVGEVMQCMGIWFVAVVVIMYCGCGHVLLVWCAQVGMAAALWVWSSVMLWVWFSLPCASWTASCWRVSSSCSRLV